VKILIDHFYHHLYSPF